MISFQDNTSIIKLLENGRSSEGKRTRHFDIWLFHIKDLIDRKEVVVDHFSSDEMIDDYMSNNLAPIVNKCNCQHIMSIRSPS